MKSHTLASTALPTDIRFSAGERLFRRLLSKALAGFKEGQLILIDALGEQRFGTASDDCPLTVRVVVDDAEFYRLAVTRGHIGAAEAYMAGHWRCDHLTDLVRLFVRNRHAMNAMESGLARLAQPLFRLYHWSRRNTRTNSRANIEAHYDLGNDFYRLFLDETMMYSCAVYPRPESDLVTASRHKLERICRKLDLKPDDHLLEIGTGWGELAIHAASHYGCRVTTTTISKEQYRLARERVARAGLTDRITVLCDDYRDLTGQYDKLVSVEMIEAVGHQYLDSYVQTCSRLLKPQGMMLLQSITIMDQHYEAAKTWGDFIQRYIFPGGFLPSVAALSDAVARVSDMRIFHLEDIGPHYARTLRDWRERFLANLDGVRALGFSESFIRMWEFYLCYCEGGFLERNIGTVQLLLVKPRNRREPILPALEGI